MKRMILWGLSAFLLATSLRAAEPEALPLDGEIRQVTLYRDQALVTRRIEVPAGEGVRVIAISRLPEMLVEDSAYAEGDANTEIRAVRVSKRVIAQSEREDVRKLTLEIEELQKQMAMANNQLQVATQNLASLEQLMNFTAATAHGDLNRGVLNGDTLITLSKYAMEGRAERAAEKLELEQQTKEFEKQIALKSQELNLISQATTKEQSEARIVVTTKDGGAGVVDFSYRVSGCSWSPQYVIRGSLGEKSFTLRYSALVQQMSGEPWNQAKLILSTASPSINASGPTLTPFRVTCAPFNGAQADSNDPFGGPQQAAIPAYANSDGGDMLQQKAQSLRRKQNEVEQSYQGNTAKALPMQRDLELNNIATELQNLELMVHAKQTSGLANDAQEDVSSQTYTIEQDVTLDSRREQQWVQIVESKLEGNLYHVAIPLLSSYAYREAELVNSQEFSLLGGPATIYLDDRFVGKADIPSTASGQRLIIGFGADPQVRTRRELLTKTDDVQGGNRRVKFSYRLVVSNFKSQPVDIRLMDRLPLAQRANEISVRLESPTTEISSDELYKRMQEPRGILRWDLQVAPGTHGSKATDVNYAYTVEFDRNRSLAAVASNDIMQVDYLEMAAPAMGGGMGGAPQP